MQFTEALTLYESWFDRAREAFPLPERQDEFSALMRIPKEDASIAEPQGWILCEREGVALAYVFNHGGVVVLMPGENGQPQGSILSGDGRIVLMTTPGDEGTIMDWPFDALASETAHLPGLDGNEE